MKVVGICGSPRKGNTEWMLRRLLEFISQGGIQTELILLSDEKIKGCKGCLKCDEGGKERKGQCRIDDNMSRIYPELIQADALVFGTPVYFDMLSGLLKNFMDRTCPIWPKLEGKYAVGLAVAEEGIGAAVENLKSYAGICRMNWVGSVTALARSREQVVEDMDLPGRILQLADKLAEALKTRS